MIRRQFLTLLLTHLLLLTPLASFASDKTIEYEAGALQKQLDAGKTVLVDYYTN